MREWGNLAERVLAGGATNRDEALAILNAPDDEVPALVAAAFELRRRFFGRAVNLHVLMNAKSGHCGEDCGFCSQSAVSSSSIERYSLRGVDEIVEGAVEAHRLGAVKYCTVISGRSPTAADMDTICEALTRIKKMVTIHLCVSAGILTEPEARRLKQAGADRINHNLETSRAFFPRICTTHTYDERLATLRNAKAAGLEICCGGLVGLGERLEDRVELALALREEGVDSIPVNLFNPRAGTPLSLVPRLSAADGLRALAMFRFVNPSKDIRAAGGREACLGHMQVLALYVANSIFTQGYLTTEGQGHSSDMALLRDAGFTIGRLEA